MKGFRLLGEDLELKLLGQDRPELQEEKEPIYGLIENEDEAYMQIELIRDRLFQKFYNPVNLIR